MKNNIIDRVPEAVLVLLFGVAVSAGVFVFGLLLMVLSWAFA